MQEQLERSTEHLAELTEKPVDKMDRAEVRPMQSCWRFTVRMHRSACHLISLLAFLCLQVINFTRVTMQFLRNLLSGIDDGLTA